MSSNTIGSSRWVAFAERDGRFHFLLPTRRADTVSLLCGYRPDRAALRRRQELDPRDRRLSGRQCRDCPDMATSTRPRGTVEVAARRLLPANYEVIPKPRDLADIFERYGVVPEAMLVSRDTGRFVFVEVKKQGERGNAEERAYKHYAPGFIRLLHERYGFDYHPFVTVFCESLATDRRYTEKIRQMLDYPHYCLWAGYRRDLLARWLEDVARVWLD